MLCPTKGLDDTMLECLAFGARTNGWMFGLGCAGTCRAARCTTQTVVDVSGEEGGNLRVQP